MECPHALAELDGKHIAMKKPKKSESEFYNYNGFFSLVLLALVDSDYRFLWYMLGQSLSDAQIFNQQFEEKDREWYLGASGN